MMCVNKYLRSVYELRTPTAISIDPYDHLENRIDSDKDSELICMLMAAAEYITLL